MSGHVTLAADEECRVPHGLDESYASTITAVELDGNETIIRGHHMSSNSGLSDSSLAQKSFLSGNTKTVVKTAPFLRPIAPLPSYKLKNSALQASNASAVRIGKTTPTHQNIRSTLDKSLASQRSSLAIQDDPVKHSLTLSAGSSQNSLSSPMNHQLSGCRYEPAKKKAATSATVPWERQFTRSQQKMPDKPTASLWQAFNDTTSDYRTTQPIGNSNKSGESGHLIEKVRSVSFALDKNNQIMRDAMSSPSQTSSCSKTLPNESTGKAAVSMEGDPETDKTLLSIIWQRGLLGACIYRTDSRIIHLVQDIPESNTFISTAQLFRQTEPDVVITGSKQDAKFLTHLKTLASNDDKRPTSVHTILNTELGFEACKHRIYNALEDSLAKGKADQSSFLGSLINAEHTNMVRAAGGLIRYVETNLVYLFISDPENEVLFVGMDMYYLALQILRQADHPSTALGNLYTREAFSLYGLMDRCATTIGKKKLKEWFLQPSKNKQLLNNRLDSIEYFSKASNSEVTQLLKVHVKKLRHMTRIAARMRNAALSANDWLALHRVLSSVIYIADVCGQRVSDLQIFSKFHDHVDSLHTAGQFVFQILDVEMTRLEKAFTVRANYDPELDELVRQYRETPSLIAATLAAELKEVKKISKSSVNIHFSSQLGCMYMVEVTQKMERSQEYELPGLKMECVSTLLCISDGSINQIVFEPNCFYVHRFSVCKIFPLNLVEVSSKYGDAKTAVTDHELSLMHQLQNTLLPHMASVLTVLDHCAEIDCLIGLSIFCSERNYVRPELTDTNEISVIDSRHPLLAEQVEQFVSNDIHSADQMSKLMVITGPNACGKSVYLKQVSLIVYLAHIGSFVPASSATIGLVDAIYTHFQSQESVNTNVSTFTSDLHNLSAIVSNATGKSLVILDEFGKGTNTVDGAALLLATLKHWLSQAPQRCPHVFSTTHYHVIGKSELLKKCSHASLKVMNTVEGGGTLTYLYELMDGSSQQSHVAHVMKMLDIANDCLDKGSQAHNRARKTCQGQTEQQVKNCNQMRKILDQLLQLDLEDEASIGMLLDITRDEP